ncbi:hypothetical protein MYX84_11690 [Acidobacteria bacterium AH-259-O06]|nr:hypothetical protein [Acidobacteria bacterium AH-259-O06]
MIWLGLVLSLTGMAILTAINLVWAGASARVQGWVEKIGLALLVIGIAVAILST